MRVDNCINFVKTNSEVKSISSGQDNTIQVKQPKSLLDYCCISEKSETVMPSLCYTKMGDYLDECSKVVRQLNFCEKAKAGYPYDESKLGKEDVWITKGHSTEYIMPNQDKMNYLIHYYMERGGDMSTYPFENDSEKTKTAYKSIVRMEASKAIEESRLKYVFEKYGISEGTIVVDAKGEVSIETDEEVSLEKKESMKKQLMEAGGTADALRNMVFSEGSRFAHLSSEKQIETDNMYYVGWILYRYYSVRIEDLSIAEDGSISGLPDEVYKKYDYQSLTDFYGHIRQLIRRGGASEDELGRFVYSNGKLFVL